MMVLSVAFVLGMDYGMIFDFVGVMAVLFLQGMLYSALLALWNHLRRIVPRRTTGSTNKEAARFDESDIDSSTSLCHPLVVPDSSSGHHRSEMSVDNADVIFLDIDISNARSAVSRNREPDETHGRSTEPISPLSLRLQALDFAADQSDEESILLESIQRPLSGQLVNRCSSIICTNTGPNLHGSSGALNVSLKLLEKIQRQQSSGRSSETIRKRLRKSADAYDGAKQNTIVKSPRSRRVMDGNSGGNLSIDSAVSFLRTSPHSDRRDLRDKVPQGEGKRSPSRSLSYSDQVILERLRQSASSKLDFY